MKGMWSAKSMEFGVSKITLAGNICGVLRTTFLIGPDGKIKKVYENVKPADHSKEILADIKV